MANNENGPLHINQPNVSKEVWDEIQKAERMRDFILASIPGTIVLDTDEKVLVAGYFSLTIEHHGAILYLLRTGTFDGSASALVRPLVEAAYRAHWTYCCATPDQLASARRGMSVYPGLSKMTSDVSNRIPAGGIFAAVKRYINTMHGYTHGGFEQLSRRFDAGGNISPTYSDAEKLDVIIATTAHLNALSIAWCVLTSDDDSGDASCAKAVSDYYRALYGDPTDAAP